MSTYPHASAPQLERAVERAKTKMTARMSFPQACYQAAGELGIPHEQLLQEMARRAKLRRSRRQGRAAK